MKLKTLMTVLFAGLMGNGTAAHSAGMKVERTTLCNIVGHPSDFIGKTVEIEAQIWADYRYPDLFWMNESSNQLKTVCQFLQASFIQGTDLSGQTAFGTFRGRIVKKQSRQASTVFGSDPKGLRMTLLVDKASDIHLRRDYLDGPIPKLQLFDTKTGTFVRPVD